MYVKSGDDLDPEVEFKNTLSELKDDFDYAISGLEKLHRGTQNLQNAANSIAMELYNKLQEIISEVADNLDEYEV